MRRIDRYIGTLFLATSIVAPALVEAEARAQEASVQVRVYDQGHHGYHNWNNGGDLAYGHYLIVEHRITVKYHRQHHSVQKHYWS